MRRDRAQALNNSKCDEFPNEVPPDSATLREGDPAEAENRLREAGFQGRKRPTTFIALFGKVLRAKIEQGMPGK